MAKYRTQYVSQNGRMLELEPFDAPTVAAAKRRHEAAMRNLRATMAWTHELGGRERIIAGPDAR